MFSGIIIEKGKVLRTPPPEGGEVVILGPRSSKEVEIGSSLAVCGVCLTVIKIDGSKLTMEVMPETLRCTNIGRLKIGDPVNLEPSLKIGGELGGHFVLGHVDAVGTVREWTIEDNWRTMRVSAPVEIMKFLAYKGSVAMEGVSLTLSRQLEDGFEVSLIEHTLKLTNLGDKKIGDKVNLEVDVIARYLERLTDQDERDRGRN